MSVRWLVLIEHDIELSNQVSTHFSVTAEERCEKFLRRVFFSPTICIPGDKHILQKTKIVFRCISQPHGNEIAEFIKASLGNELIWYQHALIRQWRLSVVANSLPDIPPPCPSNQTLALIAGWIKHELYVQGGPRIKTRSNPKQTDMLLTVRDPFHIIIPMKSLFVEFDFSSSGNLECYPSRHLLAQALGIFFALHPSRPIFAVVCTLEICGLVIRVPAWRREKRNLVFCHLAQNGVTCFGQGYKKTQRISLRRLTTKETASTKLRVGDFDRNFQIRMVFSR